MPTEVAALDLGKRPPILNLAADLPCVRGKSWTTGRCQLDLVMVQTNPQNRRVFQLFSTVGPSC